MDFCHLIVTCLFSMLRLPFDNQKVKGNYAIFFEKLPADYFRRDTVHHPGFCSNSGLIYLSDCGIGYRYIQSLNILFSTKTFL